jgi:guanylate kinase
MLLLPEREIVPGFDPCVANQTSLVINYIDTDLYFFIKRRYPERVQSFYNTDSLVRIEEYSSSTTEGTEHIANLIGLAEEHLNAFNEKRKTYIFRDNFETEYKKNTAYDTNLNFREFCSYKFMFANLRNYDGTPCVHVLFKIVAGKKCYLNLNHEDIAKIKKLSLPLSSKFLATILLEGLHPIINLSGKERELILDTIDQYILELIRRSVVVFPELNESLIPPNYEG